MVWEISTKEELIRSVDIIRQAFTPVADQFNLTPDNCPTHPSFITHENLLGLKKKGLRLFGLYTNSTQIGFVAIEKSSDNLFFIEKMAVVPHYRQQSFGTRLVRFALDHIKKNNGAIGRKT